jgi:type II secretion system protein H
MSPRLASRQNAGFTLVETLVVLAIIGLLGGIMALGLTGRLPGIGMDAAVDAAIAELRQRQTEAMLTATSVRFDPKRLDDLSITPERRRRLRRLAAVQMRIESPNTENVLVFLPGGWSPGGRLYLRKGAEQAIIRVDWPLGTVHQEAIP